MRFQCPPLTRFPTELHHASTMQRIAYFIATTGWTGHLPASGTWGAGVAFFLHALFFPRVLTVEQWPYAVSILTIVLIVGTWSADVVEKMTGKKDDSRVTIDEVAGYVIAVFLLPAGLQYTVPGFLLARSFDILKPPPAYRFQTLRGGLGIMIDDVIASIYACALMHSLVRIFYT